MATALARGLARAGALPAGAPLVSDAVGERAQALAAEVGGRAAGSNEEVAEGSDLVLLCHKPPQLEEVAAGIAGRVRAVASILWGTPVAAVEAAYPGVPAYRLMPNVAVEAGEGVLLYAPGSRAGEGPERELLELLGGIGTVVPLDERLIDTAGAVTACGPAFLALAAEALAAGATAAQAELDRGEALRLSGETLAGTAALLRASGYDAGALRTRVATPGGVTERGLAALEERDVRGAFAGALEAVLGAGRP